MATMDAIELLSHDHRMVEQLFRDYAAAASEAQRKGVVDILIRELSKHAALEELMVYPLAKQVLEGGASEIDQHLDEHMTVKRLLAELDGMPASDERMTGLVDQLQQAIEEHVREEEGTLFPRLRAATDQQALAELGTALDEGKSTAPTRPHPHAPTEPPALAIAAPVAAIYDRLRDRLAGRPRT
jgi:hemerythrin superfamily protein